MGEQENHNQEVSIPKSVTLGGVTYPIGETPELQQLIQSVASVEKTKLYSKFDGLKKQIEGLQSAQVVPDVKQPLDTKALIETLKAELSGNFVTKEDLKEGLKEVVQPLLNSTKEAHEKELSAYRDSIINKNLAVCIPELVKGNTKEEIDASLQDSIKLRAKYPSANVPYVPEGKTIDPNLQAQAKQPEFRAESPTNPIYGGSEKPVTGSVQRPQAPVVPPMHQQPDGSQQPTSPRSISTKEFAAKREAMLAELQSVYGGNSETIL